MPASNRFINNAALATVFICLFGLSPAGASTISYSVDGVAPVNYANVLNNGFPSDTVEILAFTGTLNLAAGTVIQQVNTAHWTVDFSAIGPPDSFVAPVSANRNILVDAVTGGLSQSGTLSVSACCDTLSFAGGLTTTLTVDGFFVSITPLALADWVRSDLGPADQAMFAQFDITATPLPAALPLFASGLGALGLLGWRRKRKAAANIAA